MGEKTTMSVLEGNNFVVSDLRGDIDASPSEPLGLFAWDTRFLSRWLLTVDGQRPNLLSTDDLDYFYIQFFLVPGTGTIYVDSDLSIIRKRAVGNGFHEEVTILNHKDKPVDLKVRMEAAADFADLFEVKDALKKKGEFYQRIESDRLVLGYRREAFTRETWIISSAKADIDEHGLSFAVHGSTHTGTAMAMAMSSTAAATRRRDWRTSAGKTPGTRSYSPMAPSRVCRVRPAKFRATSTTPICAVRVWLARSGMILHSPTA